jgi:hypothetical protein
MFIMVAAVLTLAAAQADPQSKGAGPESLVGAWHLVKIDASDHAGQHSPKKQPIGMLIYTSDGHMSVQLMYPTSANSPDNEYVRGGYEASFGGYDVDEARHIVTHHVQGSITRDLLLGKDLPRVYQLTGDGHLIISSTDPREHWSVTWEHY